jgi:hypothetical protein
VLSTKVGRLFRAFHNAEKFEHGFWRGGLKFQEGRARHNAPRSTSAAVMPRRSCSARWRRLIPSARRIVLIGG